MHPNLEVSRNFLLVKDSKANGLARILQVVPGISQMHLSQIEEVCLRLSSNGKITRVMHRQLAAIIKHYIKIGGILPDKYDWQGAVMEADAIEASAAEEARKHIISRSGGETNVKFIDRFQR